ncbi:MAG TPA: OsmC family protein [Candidatus Baltobacteraceae bacterium]|jgi:organic hydroperoxide reductase OsmC/OhrA|nr:OsmC family protein [Candidatus Baltobacteraceae bacterium]
MAPDTHRYVATVTWTGNRGSGTARYDAYGREHEIEADGKSVPIPGSSIPQFRGNAERYNPEELLVAALSSCHMLWFLHLCATERVIVTGYRDRAEGSMKLNADGSGQFTEVVLHPHVTIEDPQRAHVLPALHERAHELCFIARSVSFPVRCDPS